VGSPTFVVDMVVKKAVPKLVAMFHPRRGLSSPRSSRSTTPSWCSSTRSRRSSRSSPASSTRSWRSPRATSERPPARSRGILARLLSLAINFLAGFAGLGKVADKIMGRHPEGARAPIDKALDWLIGWIVGHGEEALRKHLRQGQERRRETTGAEGRADPRQGERGRPTRCWPTRPPPRTTCAPRLPSIKSKYKLTVLTLVSDEQAELTETDHIHAEVNPGKDGPEEAEAEEDGAGDHHLQVLQEVPPGLVQVAGLGAGRRD